MNKEQIKLLNSKLENSYYDYIETDDINILAYMTEIIYALVKEYEIPICEFENIKSEKEKMWLLLIYFQKVQVVVI